MSLNRSSSPDMATRSRINSPQVYDLYADLFSQPATIETSSDVSASPRLREGIKSQVAPAPPPRSPLTLADSGLSMGQLSDLVLKTLYVQGVLQGSDLSRSIRLPFNILDESLRVLRDQKLVEVGVRGYGGAHFIPIRVDRIRAIACP